MGGAVARATSMEQEAEAARGYRMIGSSASVLVEYDRAEWWLAEGAGYAGQVELWNHRHYMAAHLAHVQWATGQWDAAAQTAQVIENMRTILQAVWGQVATSNFATSVPSPA